MNAGFLNGADLSEAQHGVWYAWSKYRDAMRRYKDENRLKKAAQGTRELAHGVHLGAQALVFDDIRETAYNGDYRTFAGYMDQAMKEWGILPEGTGYVDGKLVSDTKEIEFDPDHARFHIHTDYCGYFSGAPEELITLSDTVTVKAENERITLALIAKEEKPLKDAEEYILTAMGTSGMDATTYTQGQEVPGMPFEFTAVAMKGKLYVETLEGCIRVKAEDVRLEILSPVGDVLTQMDGEKAGEEVHFILDGSIPGVQYRLVIKR